jgi:hypothetical protein
MIKLIDLLREVQEGARVTFDDTGNASKIDIAYKHLDGEQLGTYNNVIKKNSYSVYYSLESVSGADNIKKAEDTLKYDSQLIKPAELKDLLSNTLGAEIAKVDYIGYLESKGGLNKVLINTVKELYGVSDENVVEVKKVEYMNIDDAVDWESYNKLKSEPLKKDIIKFLYKTAEKAPPYKIKKSSGEEGGGTQSIIVKQLQSKYDLGLNPNLKNKSLPPIYDVLVKCIEQGKTLLIVDDNMHAGIDFYKIFGAVRDLVDKLKEVNARPTTEEEGVEEKLASWERHPKRKTSSHVQQEIERLEKILKVRRERIELINRDLNGSNQRIFGYVLYNLTSQDIKG